METVHNIIKSENLNMELVSFIHQQISLIENHHIEIQDNGLYSGKAGVVILYFTLFHYTGEKVWEEKAKSLLDEISEQIASVQELNYSQGLAGIGWAIEWIKQNGFMEINTDEVLEDIDDILYKAVLFAQDKTISLSAGTLGKAVYFLKRFESKNPGTHRYKTISHQECLVLLTDEINEAVIGEKGLLHQFDGGDIPAKEQLLDLSHTIIFLSKIYYHKINAEIVERSLYALIKYAASILDEFSDKGKIFGHTNEECEDFIYVAYAYYTAGFKLKYENWQQKGQRYIDRILDKLSLAEDSENDTQFVPVLCCLYQHTGEKYYFQKLMEICRVMDHLSGTFALQGRMGKVLMGAISCIFPETISWDEASLYD